MNIFNSPFQPQLSSFPIRQFQYLLLGLPTFTLALLQPSPHRASRRIKDINPIMSLPLLQIFKCFLKNSIKTHPQGLTQSGPQHCLSLNSQTLPLSTPLSLQPHRTSFYPLNLPSIPPADHSYLVLSFPSDISLNITSHLRGTFLQCFHPRKFPRLPLSHHIALFS